MKPSTNKVPKHIGIIMDGNRRFAKRLMLKPWKGHEWAAEKIEKIMDWCLEYNVKELTLYAMSLENFNRPKQEFNYLMDLFKKEFENFKNNPKLKFTKVNFIGRTNMFSKDIQDIMHYLMNKTKNNKKFTLNFAMAYSGRAEIIDAIKKLGKNHDLNKINEKILSKNLYLKDEPDLIIRTGGEKRTSNFLVWQSSYSEWAFLDVLFPEFDKEDFITCMEDYSKRERRFGR